MRSSSTRRRASLVLSWKKSRCCVNVTASATARSRPTRDSTHVSSLKRSRNVGSAVVLTSLRLCSEMLKLRDALAERREFVCASR